MDSKEVLLLKKALERQKKARIQAEKILEEKSKELYDATHHLKETNNRLEGLLSEKTSELDGVFINVVDPYIVMDLSFNILKMNASAKEFLGYDSDKEHINLSRLIHKDYIEYTAESIKILLDVGILKNYQAKIIVKDQSEKFIQINGSLIYDKNRKAIAAQGIIRDVTEETEIKELLAKQKRRQDIIVENSPLGIVLTVDGRIIQANSAMHNMMGYSGSELKNLHVKDISTPEKGSDSLALMQKMNRGELDNFSILKQYIRKDKTLVLAKTSVNAVKNLEGDVAYQVAIVEDITEQHNLELQKEQLLKELESSNQGLREYAHIVSHDLKSPLRSINALASWLHDDYQDVLDETGQYNLRLMQEKIEGMDALIDGILKYSSINSSSLTRSRVDLNRVVSEIREIIFVPDHVEIFIMNTLPTITTDKTKMHQLFQNLIGNAVMHIEREQGLVEIHSEELKNYWKFSITDNGIGISKEYHSKIFQVFQSLDSDNSSTGIGLSIVKKIVELYKGEIWVDSEVGKGSTFHFTLKK